MINIFKEHFETLKRYNSDNYSIGDILLFVVLPAVLAYALIKYKISITNNVINILITSFSIFAALLFNLLLLIYDIVSKSTERKLSKLNNVNEINAKINNNINKIRNRKQTLSLKEKLLKQTYANVSFNIIISIISITFLFLLYIMKETTTPNAVDGENSSQTVLDIFENTIPVLSFFIYYFLVQFMLTLLMILKRIHVLLSKEFE